VADEIAAGKRAQAAAIMARQGLAGWLAVVRETGAGGGSPDPVQALWAPVAVVGLAALLLRPDGAATAVVANYDRLAMERSGHFEQVLAYDQDWRPALLQALDALPEGRIGVNFSIHDHLADGISHGCYLALADALAGSRHAGRLTGAEGAAAELRGVKIPAEITRLRDAARLTEGLFAELGPRLRPGVTERQVYEYVHGRLREMGLGTAWDPLICPSVNIGARSEHGHVGPSDLAASPGDLVHLDFGVLAADYCADLQRMWFLPEPGRISPPEEVLLAFEAVHGAIRAGMAVLRPGVAGFEVDEAARAHLRDAGYPEFQHAFGHQLGRACHDGGGVLGPRWPRYAARSRLPVRPGQVWTLELGVPTPRGSLSLEEMVLVTEHGATWLSEPQDSLWMAG
jgi:Xaa-Pro aminopeptidase